MKNKWLLLILVYCLLIPVIILAQSSPGAGDWATWFIKSGKEFRVPAPAPFKTEIQDVLQFQQKLDSTGRAAIDYWNAGSPGYHWMNLMGATWMTDVTGRGALANMLLNVAIYDATVAAWNAKYTYNRPRPYYADKRIKPITVINQDPSYPCEHSVAAGVAVGIFSYFYPALADSVKKLAQDAMASRVAAGAAFPSDTKAGFELGKAIAEKEIQATLDFVTTEKWDGKLPQRPQTWNGAKPASPMAGKNKTVVLTSGSQFRPLPPPDFAKDMAELKNFKPNFSAKANAFFFASESYWNDLLHQKIFEHNIHLDAPLAAKIYAVVSISTYDGFIACWDAKYAYWGIRPDQYDTTYKPLIGTPPFPGYPSGHAALSATAAGIYSYFFPADRAFFEKRARDAAESRFQAGIHFRTDNEVALELGAKIAQAIVAKLQSQVHR